MPCPRRRGSASPRCRLIPFSVRVPSGQASAPAEVAKEESQGPVQSAPCDLSCECNVVPVVASPWSEDSSISDGDSDVLSSADSGDAGYQDHTDLGDFMDAAADEDNSRTESRPTKRPRPPRADTLMFIDWDDTLLPSSFLRAEGLRIDGAEPSKEQADLLRRAARRSARTLRTAKRLGSVVIVTNAEWGWVELSCSRFMPSLMPLLEGVKIRSARSVFEPQGVQSPRSWKQMCFAEELHGFCEAAKEKGYIANVLSLGDSVHERDALLRVTDDLPGCWGKSVKLIDRPTMDLFRKEHKYVNLCLKPVVQHGGKLDLCLHWEGCSL